MQDDCYGKGMRKLRAYQQEAVANIEKAWRNSRSVIFQLPTGGGKSAIAAAIAAKYVRRGKYVLSLAHRVELIEQMYDNMLAAGIPEQEVGVIRGPEKGDKLRPDALVQIASMQTLAARPGEAPKSDLVFIDEAHRTDKDNTYGKILRQFPSAKVLGLTATPCRPSGGALGGLYDCIAEGPNYEDLIELGVLVRPKLWSQPLSGALDEALEDVSVSHGDFNEVALSKLMCKRQNVGAIVPHWKKHARGERTVVFCCDVEHCRVVADEFKYANIKCVIVTGDTPAAARKEILEPGGLLDRGTVKVVITCNVLTEGWDMPSLECIVMARPTRSLVMYLQQAGRVCRALGDKQAKILDHAGNVRRHGRPYQARVWDLHGTMRAGKGVVPVKDCPQCEAIILAGSAECPECGYEFPVSREVETVDGELVELEAARVAERERVIKLVLGMGKSRSAAEKIAEFRANAVM